MTDSLVADFTDAWEQAGGDDFSSTLSRRSLAASAQGHPVLMHALAELQRPAQEQLDLKITGPGVSGHSTSSEALAALYADISVAVKSMAKSLRGKGRWQPVLFATAPAPGSLCVRFEAPSAPRTQESIRGTEVPSWEGQSLRALVNLLAQAEDENADDAVLVSTTAKLPKKAREALRNLARTAAKVNWDVESTLEARGRGTIHARLTPASAGRIVSATEARTVSTTPVDMSGVGDGWTWSSATLKFIPDHGRPFSASVPPHLQLAIAKLITSPDTKLHARFLQTQTRPAGSSDALSTSYSLDSVEILKD